MRTIVDAAALPAASTVHAWGAEEDLSDRRVKVAALVDRDAAAQELEEAFCIGILVHLYGAPNSTSAGPAAARLVEAQLAARVAEMALASQWRRLVGGSIQRKPGIVEARLKASEAARMAAEAARRVAQEAERERAYHARRATEPPPPPPDLAQVAAFQRVVRRVRPTVPLGAPSVATECQVSLEKAGLNAEVS